MTTKQSKSEEALHGPVTLFCGKTSTTAHLFGQDGKWDTQKFRDHVDKCRKCQFMVKKVMGLIASHTSESKSAASRANGKKGGRPTKEQQAEKASVTAFAAEAGSEAMAAFAKATGEIEKKKAIHENHNSAAVN